MKDEAVLRGKVREAVAAGRIPARLPERMWAGRASRGACAVCSLPLKVDEVVLEIEYVAGDGAAPAAHDTHIRCYVALQEELGGMTEATTSASQESSPASAAWLAGKPGERST